MAPGRKKGSTNTLLDQTRHTRRIVRPSSVVLPCVVVVVAAVVFVHRNETWDCVSLVSDWRLLLRRLFGKGASSFGSIILMVSVLALVILVSNCRNCCSKKNHKNQMQRFWYRSCIRIECPRRLGCLLWLLFVCVDRSA